MSKCFFLFIVLVTVETLASTHVAVLETISDKAVVGRSERMFVTDKLRERASAVLPASMGYVVMTRENINAMLPPGKAIEDCEGSCLVETGKNISADYVAQARMGKFGKQFTITIELYETSGNNLMGSLTARTHNIEGLLDKIERESDLLFKKILLEKSIDVKENFNSMVFEDSRTGQKYRTVKIGKQMWMAENLNFKTAESYCYENRESNCMKYGRLYTWSAAKNACPTGWHLPSAKEFRPLYEFAGGLSEAGKKLKSKVGWRKLRDWIGEENGVDSYGFSVFPAGIRGYDGNFVLEGYQSVFWSSTEIDNDFVAVSELVCNRDGVNLNGSNKGNGLSVRCLKD